MPKSSLKEKMKKKKPVLAEKLLQLNDDFAEYSEVSAFLCRAMTSALSDPESLDECAVLGAKRCSAWLQIRADELQKSLRHVHKRYVDEQR